MKRWKYKLEGGGRAGWGRMAYRAGDETVLSLLATGGKVLS